jgi:hypothetical protein
MKNFLPLIIIILIAILFAILAVQSSKIIEGNTNMSSNDATCIYGNWSTTGTCVDGKIEQTQNLTSGGTSCSPTKTREIACNVSSNSVDLTNNTKCSKPSDITGYEFTHENLSINNFEIGGLKCASDYYGNPTAEACSSAGTPYSLKGCTRITASVENANPSEIIVSFSKPITINGNTEDLKNNFKYKIDSVDVEYKSPIKAQLQGNNKIKITTSREVPQDKTVVVKYRQNKVKNQDGVELLVDDIKLDMTDEISVVNNVIDTSAPILKIAHITDDDASTIILVFNETLQHNPVLKASDFKIKINEGIGRTPNRVITNNDKLIISLRQTIQKGQRVQISYIKNSSDDSKHVKDIYNNSLESLENISVVNNVGYPNKPISFDSEKESRSMDNLFTKKTVTDKETAYFNDQYIRSIGQHNPFYFLNEKSGMDCKIDPNNKNKAICDLNRNKPIRPINVHDLKDNRGDEKDKYILKTKIVPVVYPRCATCEDNNNSNSNSNSDDDIKLDTSSLDNLSSSIKNKLKLSKPTFKKVKLDDEFSVGNPLQLNKSLSKILDVQDNLKLDKYDRSIKRKDNNKIKLNTDIKIPKIAEKIVEDTSKLANIVPPRFENENTPTPLVNEITNVKQNSPSDGFIPRLTSFSKF